MTASRTMRSRRHLFGWISLTAAVALSVAWNQVPLGDAAGRVAKLPVASDRLVMSDLPFTAAECSVLGDAIAARRRYSSAAGSWIVTVIDGTANRHALHDPTFCLRGAGWTLENEQTVTIGCGTGRRLALSHHGECVDMIAWYSDGSRHFSRPAVAWFRSALRRLTFGASGSAVTLVTIQFTRDAPPEPRFMAALEAL